MLAIDGIVMGKLPVYVVFFIAFIFVFGLLSPDIIVSLNRKRTIPPPILKVFSPILITSRVNSPATMKNRRTTAERRTAFKMALLLLLSLKPLVTAINKAAEPI